MSSRRQKYISGCFLGISTELYEPLVDCFSDGFHKCIMMIKSIITLRRVCLFPDVMGLVIVTLTVKFTVALYLTILELYVKTTNLFRNNYLNYDCASAKKLRTFQRVIQ